MSKESLRVEAEVRNRPGIVLLVTVVLMVVLSILGYTLTARLGAQRHRDRYIIDYSIARFGRDSAVKYALATLEDINAELISRPNEPDFSDLFMLSDEEYDELLAQWAAEKALLGEQPVADFNDSNDITDFNNFTGSNGLSDFSGLTDFNSFGDSNDFGDFNSIIDFKEPESLVIRGPYGPAWPLVTEPVEFEIGSAQVRIEIEDENAKYPLGWALLDEPLIQREVTAGFQTFCEWMGVEDVEDEIDSFKSELERLKDEGIQLKPFKLEFKPIRKRERVRETAAERRDTRKGRARKRGRRSPQVKTKTTVKSVAEQMTDQAVDYSKLLHSSLIDNELLARPIIVSDRRKESALKYMGMWGSMKVNINTAPRHVLEAALGFGADADQIAEEIIQRRRIKPFADVAELKRALFQYSDSIDKCEKYITAASSFFTVRVTAVSGAAKASAVIAIRKDGNQVRRIGIISI